MRSVVATIERHARTAGASGLVVAAIAATAAGILVVRFPTALAGFDRRAATNAAATPLERLIAGADGLDIDNPFLAEALQRLPEDASYALVRSASVADAQRRGIVPTTYNALPGYVQFLLLPRRQVEPRHARWLLCYGCELGAFHDLDVVWRGAPDLAIARFAR
jgi:hypothetical protein